MEDYHGQIKRKYHRSFYGAFGMAGVSGRASAPSGAVNIIDYGTGLAAAKYREQKISSYKGFRGIAKKVCMWLLVVVGAITDSLITYAAQQAGITLNFGYAVASLVAVWLICNEIISILEICRVLDCSLSEIIEYVPSNTKESY